MNRGSMTSIQPIGSSPFDPIRKTNSDGNEFWSARDLMPLLGYGAWAKFLDSIERAKASCETSAESVENHFARAGKLVKVGSGAQRTVQDFNLSRHAAHLVAMNSDARKVEVAAAQKYFSSQVRRAEIEQARPVLPASPLALSRALLEALEQQDTRVTAIEQRLDASPITSEKVGVIFRLGQMLGQHMGNYSSAWRLFKNRFHLASYRDLPSDKYEDAVHFLKVQIASYTGTPLLEID